MAGLSELRDRLAELAVRRGEVEVCRVRVLCVTEECVYEVTGADLTMYGAELCVVLRVEGGD